MPLRRPGCPLLLAGRLITGVTVLTQGESVNTCMASSWVHSATCLPFQVASSAANNAIVRGNTNAGNVRNISFLSPVSINVHHNGSVTDNVEKGEHGCNTR